MQWYFKRLIESEASGGVGLPSDRVRQNAKGPTAV